MRWFSSPVRVVLLVRALLSDPGVVSGAVDLLERSEPALYAIEQELCSLVTDGVVLQPVLGCATDRAAACSVCSPISR